MTLVGLSWGSGLAALYAAQYPDRVSRMILVSPMPITQSLMAQRCEQINALLGEADVKRRAELAARLPLATDEETVTRADRHHVPRRSNARKTG